MRHGLALAASWASPRAGGGLQHFCPFLVLVNISMLTLRMRCGWFFKCLVDGAWASTGSWKGAASDLTCPCLPFVLLKMAHFEADRQHALQVVLPAPGG